MSTKIKVVLADDHLLVMEGFRDLLNKAPNIEIVGEAADGEQAVFLATNRKPNVVLMDINMPVLDGISAAHRITKANKEVKVVMLSMHHEDRYIIMADQAGASGYLLKNIDKEELLHALEMVASGEVYYSKAIPESLVKRVVSKQYQSEGNYRNDLTTREIEILREISKGLTNKEIGDKLFISDRTVNAHRTNIMAKLQAKNAVELVVKAMEMKII
jgi:DNA-binding NarL/FixJ family response regulator